MNLQTRLHTYCMYICVNYACRNMTMFGHARVLTHLLHGNVNISTEEGLRGQKYMTECRTQKQDCTCAYLNSWSLSVTRTSLVIINPRGCRDLLFSFLIGVFACVIHNFPA